MKRLVGRSHRRLFSTKPVPHEALRRDVKYLGRALGDVIKRAPNGPIFATVEEIRHLARHWRRSDDGTDKSADQKLSELVGVVEALDPHRIREVARAFNHFLALSNAAELTHRVRRTRTREIESGPLMADAYSEYPLQPNNTTIGVVQRLLSGEPMIPGSPLSAKATADEIYDALCSQCLEIVLTAHPTEVNRRTVVRKHRAIDNALAALDGAQLWRERVAEEQNLLRQIEMLWWTDEIRRDKPTPVKEALHGLEIVASSMWHAVPAFLRRVDSELRETPGIGKPLPPDVAPVKFGSWMGGDRDGNPNVTAAVTKEVVIMSRLRGAELIHAALADLVLDMSGDAATATPALMALLPEGDAKATDRPYSFLFKTLMARLEVSADLLRAGQFRRSADPVLSAVAGAGEPANPLDAVEPLTDSGELVAALMVAYESLTEKGLLDVRNGKLVDLIRQVKCFGLGLLPLDCRNESVRHSEALAAITRFHGLGSYLDWSEEVRMNWLMRELSEKRPLLPTKGPNFESEGYRQLGPMFDETVCDTLETFDMIAQLPAESLGAYVISMSQQASDVLAVRLLQAEAGVAKPMRVVPLFETLDDLSNAPDVMKTLFSTPWYKGDIEGEQEVMLGYSDSAKDAGRLAAAWAQYTAQERLVEVAATSNVKLSLFHGKGGTVSRGGDPSTMRAICAQPPGTVSGKFRITEQGEIITQNYAKIDNAEKHLNTYAAALLYEKFLPHESRAPTQEYRALMDAMSETSCDAYREIVRGRPSFIPYFRAATPEVEIASLNVGSRPAKRRPTGGVETLRAIPWVFAWTQTRLNLTAWLGVGSALSSLNGDQKALLKDMFKSWPWFNALVDLVDMIMAKSESDIAANYDKQLVATLEPVRDDVEELLSIGQELRDDLASTKAELLNLQDYAVPQQNNDILQRGLHVRNPYVDPLNVIQAEVLKRLRRNAGEYGDDGKGALSEEEMTLLTDALAISINGIANGQKNTG